MAYSLQIDGGNHQNLITNLVTPDIPNWHATDYFTLCARVRTAGAVTGLASIVQLGHVPDGDDKAHNYILYLENTSSENRVRFRSTQADTNFTLTSTQGWAQTNTDWHTIVATADRRSDNRRLRVSVDGAAMDVLEGPKFPNTERWFVRIGASGVEHNTLQGEVAEVALWNYFLGLGANLTRTLNSLAKGFSPRLIQPHGLIAHWPLIRELGSTTGGKYLLTAEHSPEVVRHPAVIG